MPRLILSNSIFSVVIYKPFNSIFVTSDQRRLAQVPTFVLAPFVIVKRKRDIFNIKEGQKLNIVAASLVFESASDS